MTGKVDSEARIDRPIHADSLRSAGAMIFTLECFLRDCISFVNLSSIPENKMELPVRTMFRNKSAYTSQSPRFMTEL